jgi:hypothetical protein
VRVHDRPISQRSPRNLGLDELREKRDLLLPAVQIATDQGHEHGLLSRCAVAPGWSELINGAGPFS